MRKKDETLRDALLISARNIADSQGIDAINIRSIAVQSGVATGTIYNYFSNKEEILLALTEEYWKQTLLKMHTSITANSFCEQLEQIFIFLKESISKSGGKLMGSLGKVAAEGQMRMTSMQSVLKAALIEGMDQDSDIRKDIWNDTFTKEQFAHFILMNMTMLLKTQAQDINFFLSIIKRTIY